ncbi:MAG: lysophospholipid acyltransferase family protein [Bacteroidetes bacterium]|nr:lysophospholipid acyltransferase family protein [Bacteroidota bacterium]
MKNWLLRTLIELVNRTITFSSENEAPVRALLDARRPFVLVFWHGSMTYPWWRMRSNNAAALVSQSKDGQLLADLLQSWGYSVLRGSSSRGSKEAMTAMRGAVRDGHVLCVTPDGPRGPYHEMKMGAVRVAQTMNVPLVLVSVGYRRYRRLRSWDRFEVPWPFTRARVLYSDPLTIAPELQGEPLDERRHEIEKMLNAQYREAVLEVAP